MTDQQIPGYRGEYPCRDTYLRKAIEAIEKYDIKGNTGYLDAAIGCLKNAKALDMGRSSTVHLQRRVKNGHVKWYFGEGD